MNWKALKLLSISLFMVFTAKPCAYYALGDDYRIAFFLPFNALNQHYQDFYFTFDNDEKSNERAQEYDRMRNCNEWVQHCGKSVTLKDVYEVLYNMPAGKFPETQKGSYSKKRFYQNTFIQFLLAKKNQAYRQYMNFAKTIEVNCGWKDDPWTEDMGDYKNKEGLDFDSYRAFVQCKNAFLKKRWAFLMIKLNHYGAFEPGAHEEARRYMEKNQDGSIIDSWAWFYLDANSPEQYNIHFARSIEGSREKLMPAVRLFNTKHLYSSIKCAQDKRVRSNIYVLHALNQPQRALQFIESAWHENPNNELLQLLVCREINKCEDWILTKPITGFSASVRALNIPENVDYQPWMYDTARLHDMGYARKFQAFLYKALQNDNVKHKRFWRLAAAHLAFTRGNYTMARKYLNESTFDSGTTYGEQYQLTRFLIETSARGNFDAASEADFIELYNHLDQSYIKERARLKERLVMYTANCLRKSKKLHRAALLVSHLENLVYDYSSRAYHDSFSSSWITYLTEHGNTTTADSIMHLLAKKERTGFEEFLLAKFIADKKTMNSLREWTGSLYLREQAWEKAVVALKPVPAIFWKDNKNDWNDYNQYMDANPFHAEFDHSHRHTAFDSVHYNKYTFALKAAKLARLVKRGGKKGLQAQLALAHALFNMTTHGNSWVVSRNSWESQGYGYWKEHGDDFFACKSAFKAYKSVFDKATDREVKATCCLMMQVCLQYKENYLEANYLKSTHSNNRYINLFLNAYSDTEVYRESLSMCEGPREFKKALAVN